LVDKEAINKIERDPTKIADCNLLTRCLILTALYHVTEGEKPSFSANFFIGRDPFSIGFMLDSQSSCKKIISPIGLKLRTVSS